MPLLTFVLIAEGDDLQLGEGAARLLGPELADVEIVVVGDASRLAPLAGGDPRVKLVEAPPGDRAAARNLALDAARGDYVWFLHPEDRLEPGTIAGVAERLRASAPDVLLAGRGSRRRLLDRVARDGVTTLDRRPGLADAVPGLADKVLRREHLHAIGARFAAGAHGELPVIWPALLPAERIAAAPAPRGAAAGAEPPPEGPAEAAFAGDDAVFAYLAAHPELPAERRRLVLPAMLRRGLAALDRLPRAERRAYFEALAAAWRRHRRGDEPLRGGRAARLEARLVERGDFRAFTLTRAALRGGRSLSRGRVRLERRARRGGRGLRPRRLERHYRERLEQPIDPDLAVFAAYWYRGYSCNPRAIYEKARELVPDMRGIWVVKRDAAKSMPADVEHVVEGTPEYFETLARARYFVNNVNFPNHLVKRDGTVHVMTHHGTPLKRMGMDQRESPASGARIDFAAMMRRTARWDFSVSANPFSTLVWERAYPVPFESLESGYPRNDVLASATPSDVAEAREKLALEGGRKVVLYAPTHREYVSGFSPTLDLERLAVALGPDYVLLSRAHYFYDHPRASAGEVRDVSAHPV